MAVTGKPPRCETCQSLERHRAIRGFFHSILDDQLFATLDTLQFSADPAVKPDWFRQYEYSVFGGHNSLDMQKVDRPSGRYDLIICNHVLEHVPSDGDALRELSRIVNKDGIVFLTVPDPARRRKTVDWGYPDESRHGHFREYGMDIVDKFDRHIPNMLALKTNLKDGATGTTDIAFIFAHRQNRLLRGIRLAGCDLWL
jgi:SAM-dependent methyltransferase